MSADRWSICPKCKKETDKANAKRVAGTESQYGKVTSDEYRELVRETSKPLETEPSLRQDWDIGVDEEGLFEINYGCSCKICGFEHEFKVVESVV